MECLQATHIAPNTLRMYTSGWNVWTRWIAKRSGPALPAIHGDIRQFLGERAAVVTVGTVERDLAAIRYVHMEERGIDLVDREQSEGRKVRRTIRSLKREHAGTSQRQAAPLTEEILDRMEQSFDVDRKHWRLCEVLFGGGFRVSEAAAMTVDQVEWLDNGGGRIRIPKSKGDQEGKGQWAKVPPRTMRVLDGHLDFPKGTPLFQTRKRRIATEPQTLTRWVRQAVEAIGENPRIFSGHSGRVGFALHLEKRGLRGTQIARAGRWARVETVERYLRNADDDDDFFAAFE